MQQAVMDSSEFYQPQQQMTGRMIAVEGVLRPETAPFEPQAQTPASSYDTLFPALPESAPSTQSNKSYGANRNNSKMRVGSSVVTHVFRVPLEERKFDHSDKFGEGESMRTCQNIMVETGAHIEISSSKDQSLTFLVTGKQSDVLDARRKILTNFQTQASRKVSIPKEHHRWILGKQGAKLKELEKITATKITVPSINDSSDVILIVGTKEGIEKAEHEIRVTSDEQSKKASERVRVPKMYHPFIFGPHNETLNALTEETGARINIPPPSVMKDEIVIAGEKEGVLAAKAKIEAIYQDMEKKCTAVSVEVPKSQHKYVIGPRGITIQEILQQTGVSVEMPPSDTSTGTITLRGPQDKLGLALTKVYEKANSAKAVSVDAPSWIHKYVIGKKGSEIRKITQDLPKVQVDFIDNENKIKIEGPPEEVEKAHAELQAKVKEYVDNFRFATLNVDPKYFKHIIGKSGANINRLKDETQVIINIDEHGQNEIRIEGSHEGVEKARQELEDMVSKLQNEKEKDIIIDHRLHRSIIGNKGDNIREVRDKFKEVQILFPGPGEKKDLVKLRGPKDDVDKCHKHLMKIVKELAESSYMIEVPIYKQFHKFIIGKAGANIKKIRDETQTKIDLPAEGDTNEVITITGKKENVEEAKKLIQKIQNELANIITEEITIPPQYYNSLIGAGGKLIHSIMEDCGGVIIKFPNVETKSDKVTIRGPKEDVERAKQQLIELTTEKQLSSFTAEIRAKSQHHKFLIGKNGVNIKKIRDQTGARIVFPSDKDEDQEAITIIGRKEAVENAKKQLEVIIKEIDNITESDMVVEPRHHKHFVARRGEVLHKITDECGGVTISFPRPGVQSDKVVLKGAKECIEAAKLRIQEIVNDLNAMVTMECVIPQCHHRSVMGAKGFKVQGITAEFEVQIKFPDRVNPEYQNANEEHQQINGDNESSEHDAIRQCDIIRVTGKQENCDRAIQALLDLVPITIEVDVPYDFHKSIIGQKGRYVRELMQKYDVHISVSPQEQKLNAIKIIGTPAKVEEAKIAIEERCKELEAEQEDRKLRSFELKFEVDPEYHPKIIGRRGAVINKIRTDHNVQINFPKRGDPDENIVTIQGYEQNALEAKDSIMKIVNEWNELYKEQVEIDSRVHSRLIGARGRNIRKLMDDFKVDIKFPRSDDANCNLVTIIGPEDNVLEAKDHLLNLEEEYMQDVSEAEFRESFRPSAPVLGDSFDDPKLRQHQNQTDDSNQPREFVVKGGPWEQRAPNTASVEEFPSFGRNFGPALSDPVPPVQANGAWGQPR
uniref:Putative vigilin n=1 Tax=Xenopsylla cheopis TaxID=163159 RepID=A0A6M2DT16_XENCH